MLLCVHSTEWGRNSIDVEGLEPQPSCLPRDGLPASAGRPLISHPACRLGPPRCSVVATGHYAQLAPGSGSGEVQLLRGADRGKDQTYFLASVQQAALRRVLFPIGHLQVCYCTVKRAAQLASTLIMLKCVEHCSAASVCIPRAAGNHAVYTHYHIRPALSPAAMRCCPLLLNPAAAASAQRRSCSAHLPCCRSPRSAGWRLRRGWPQLTGAALPASAS